MQLFLNFNGLQLKKKKRHFSFTMPVMVKLNELPIVILPSAVFFPNTCIPLYIFDKEGQAEMREIIRTKSPVGVALSDTISEITSGEFRPKTVATLGIPYMLADSNDQEMRVLITGVERIQLETLTMQSAIPRYRYHLHPQQKFELSTNDQRLSILKSQLEYWMDTMILDKGEKSTFAALISSPSHLIDYAAMLLLQTAQAKQAILETETAHERISLLSSLLGKESIAKENSEILMALRKFEHLDRKVAGFN